MKLKDGQSNEVAIKQQAGAVASINIEQFYLGLTTMYNELVHLFLFKFYNNNNFYLLVL